ncbi:MAG: DNA polymerase III subunit beta [Actinomycetota bacterium]
MEFRAEREVVLEAAQAAVRVASSRGAGAIGGGVRIRVAAGEVEFAANDLEMAVSVSADVIVQEEGAVVVPGRVFGEVLRSLPVGGVTVCLRGSEVLIEAGSVEFVLTSLPLGDFAEFVEVSEEAEVKVGAGELAKGVRQVVRAASTDQVRPVLTGVLWAVDAEELRLVATDTYRLAVRELSVEGGGSRREAIVPGRALSEFSRHLQVQGDGLASVRIGETQAVCTAGRARLVTRLVEGEFPNYRALIPEGYENRLVAKRAPLLEAVGRVGVVTGTGTPVKLHVGPEVRLSASEQGVGAADETVGETSYVGEPLVVGFNPRFLADGLEATEGEGVVLEFRDPRRAVVMRGEDRSDFTYLVMPVRVTE